MELENQRLFYKLEKYQKDFSNGKQGSRESTQGGKREEDAQDLLLVCEGMRKTFLGSTGNIALCARLCSKGITCIISWTLTGTL